MITQEQCLTKARENDMCAIYLESGPDLDFTKPGVFRLWDVDGVEVTEHLNVTSISYGLVVGRVWGVVEAEITGNVAMFAAGPSSSVVVNGFDVLKRLMLNEFRVVMSADPTRVHVKFDAILIGDGGKR